MIKTVLTTAFALALTTAAFAADVTGKWAGKMETPNGSRDVVFTFKQDGDKLTGSTTGRGGDIQISDGSVKGDDVMFTVVRSMNGNEMKTKYNGKLDGTTLKLKFNIMDQDRELTLTKQ